MKNDYKRHRRSLDAFGVIINLKYCKKEKLTEEEISKHVEPYTYCPYDFNEGQTIKIILNCKDNELVFKINNTEKETYTIALKPNTVYYPVILSRYNYTTFKLIPN